jgi:hypothetical protein
MRSSSHPVGQLRKLPLPYMGRQAIGDEHQERISDDLPGTVPESRRDLSENPLFTGTPRPATNGYLSKRPIRPAWQAICLWL